MAWVPLPWTSSYSGEEPVYLENLVNEQLTIGGINSVHYTGFFVYTYLHSSRTCIADVLDEFQVLEAITPKETSRRARSRSHRRCTSLVRETVHDVALLAGQDGGRELNRAAIVRPTVGQVRDRSRRRSSHCCHVERQAVQIDRTNADVLQGPRR